MIFSNKKSPQRTQNSKDIAELKKQIEASKLAISSAQNQFEHVVDPTLIDCYIYELNAAQLRYQFLLRSLKSKELMEA
ncbi:MAG: YaaL family protein [Lachnospiraceae bacterium]|nr:YaaL family protein [Lachnospiraceae bacterium]